MSFQSIVMSYKENCKVEGEIMTKFKIAKMYFAGGKSQLAISEHLGCHSNTVYAVAAICKQFEPSAAIWPYLDGRRNHISVDRLLTLFDFFRHRSRRPRGNKRSIQSDSEAEKLILVDHADKHKGVKRMFKHLERRGEDRLIYSLGKIKGVYRRHGLRGKKIRTANGERRSSYEYDEIEAFEFMQYDTKQVLDMHALPRNIYDKFKNNIDLPIYQWTIIDAKTKTRFLAWSYHRTSDFGYHFLEFTINWLRSHGVTVKINVQMDMGTEFYSGSKTKQRQWNEGLGKYDAYAYDTEGIKWKQNIVERSHRTDDEEFYCPRGSKINSKADFLVEAQYWIIYYNHRSHDGIGMNGLSPKEKLEQLGYYNAEKICNFPCLILEDFFHPFMMFFNPQMKGQKKEPISQNVLTPYPIFKIISIFTYHDEICNS